jgi:hypothetical protein
LSNLYIREIAKYRKRAREDQDSDFAEIQSPNSRHRSSVTGDGRILANSLFIDETGGDGISSPLKRLSYGTELTYQTRVIVRQKFGKNEHVVIHGEFSQ